MARQKKIIDASVLTKWFVDEPGSGPALRLREEHINGDTLLVVPELAFVEVLNALRYKQMRREALAIANAVLWDTQLHVERTSAYLLERASEAALKYDLSIYDAVYVALSAMFGAPLITADSRQASAPNAVRLDDGA